MTGAVSRLALLPPVGFEIQRAINCDVLIDGFVFGAILFVILCAIIAGGLYFASGGQILAQAQVLLLRIQLASRQNELDAPFGSRSNPIRFTIPAGAGAADIAASLYDAALINDRQLFIDYARVEGFDRRFEAGVYFLNQAQSIRQIAENLTDSSKSFIAFRLLEGARIEELAESIDQNGFFHFTGADFLALVSAGAAHPPDFTEWAGLPPGASLEGFMFPDSYQLPPDISAAALRDTLPAYLQRESWGDLASRGAGAEFKPASSRDACLDSGTRSGLAR